jgi:putative CocE/NonD family hydrolase
MVPMSDGIQLATDIFLPVHESLNTKFPAILIRLPYRPPGMPVETFEMLPPDIAGFAARGYAVVVQDVRGAGASEGDCLSEGKWLPWIYELQDGDETITWLAQQSWCDGNIGMWGQSYMGMTQWAAAFNGNPHLKAIVPQSTLGTPFNDMPFTGGAITSIGPWVFMMSGAPMDKKYDWKKILKHRPLIDIDSIEMGRRSALWHSFMTRTNYDSFWKKADWLRYEKNINVPAFHISGWYDDDLPGTLANWQMMAKNNRKNQRLILGGWRHGGNRDRAINGVSFGFDVIRNDKYVTIQKWYDRFLKGINNGVEKESVVEYFSVGDNVWKKSAQWPPKETTYQKWFFHSTGNAGALLKRGTLSTIAPPNEPPDHYRYDPDLPTPSLVNPDLNESALPDNYKELEKRADVLVYTSAPLKNDLAIAGNISAVLFASSSAKDTDWIIRLTDVDEEGNSIRLAESLIRARHRKSMEYETLLIPGKVERYVIKMRAHANVFKKGHRIRVNRCQCCRRMGTAKFKYR